MDFAQPDAERLLSQARQGRSDSLGILLERYRAYLRALACSRIDSHLRPRANASDLVQETLFLASRHFDQFQGTTEKQWLQWLRQIMRRRLFRFAREHIRTGKRNVYREIPLERESAASGLSQVPSLQVVSHASSPSACAQRRELASAVAELLGRLSPAYRDVLTYRNLQGLRFDEVARRMGRSPGAVRVLWLRALDQLRTQLTGEDWL